MKHDNLYPEITTAPMPQSPDDGANKWRCESCIYYPPSSFGGKPCSYCWEGDPYLDQYVPGDGAEERNKSMDEKLKNITEVEPDEIDLKMIKDAEAESGDEVIAFAEFLEKLDAMKEGILDGQE